MQWVSVFLLVVAGFGIYNILNMMIYEKMDSIAILKATGFPVTT
jgi:lipoprotein-releasing system permease protein